MKEKTLYMEFYIQKYGNKKKFTSKNILFDSPIHKRDRTLNTSKKEIRKWWNKKLA